jgi:SAM-dependent methyltransferase
LSGRFGQLLAVSRRLRERSCWGLPDELIPDSALPGRALDVGCGAGQLMTKLRTAGWEVEGIEWDPAAAAVARETSGATVWDGDFQHADLALSGYNLLVLSHCFEHLGNPRQALQRIYQLLAPGGRAVLLYPNPQSLGASLFRAAWFNWDPPRHLVLSPAKSLAEAAEAIGFTRATFRTASPNGRVDFKHSRASRAGRTLEELRHPDESIWDAAGAAVGQALSWTGFDVGEEVFLTLYRGEGEAR